MKEPDVLDRAFVMPLTTPADEVVAWLRSGRGGA
jgi:hypothetical protein